MEETPQIDRISQLPDILRLHILSLLPRRYAIRTGVLSNQWKDLWKHRFPGSISLDFSEKCSGGLEPDDLAAHVRSIFLKYHCWRIDSFHLSLFVFDHLQESVTSWIKHVVSRDVEDINLDFHPGQFLRPADLLLISENRFTLFEHYFQDTNGCGPVIAVMRLRWCELHPDFSFQSFRSLEVLNLFQVDVTDSIVERLVSNCPLLECLELRECNLLVYIEVSHPNSRIRRLAIIDCLNVEEIKISASNLQVFHSHGKFPTKYLFESTPSLNDVIMTSCIEEHLRKAEMVMGDNHVEVLTLCSRALQHIFGSTNSNFGAFGNLRELQLVMMQMTNENVMDIFHFFREFNFPVLEKIFIEFPTDLKDTPVFNFMNLPSAVAPEIHFNNLKMVKLTNFKNYKNEMMLVRFFIKNAVSLENIILVLDHETDCNFHSLQNEVSLMLRETGQVMVQLDDDGSVCPKHSKIYCNI
ncbi:putative FBD-associated F-box protein At1g61330 [Phoenix dactylifera]|uniref:FBD-associated F-box protein At1g61330 n=1 Tax=Phoenix dactylifera TaxID=42345 RepID=A0A8B8J9S4_PHODC|nr:putative FBD-associated F-box protein At1g61330 [Phoenix dactylifera]XP_026664317.1 putative FBD-associated F-box protein At1g61330 [Phoenix dactylifera]XP_026664319.1 putative FBD-associated F-box protein At1g61330 [Phoenix dactylifera]XP_026664320.1 putative FBD-associated F-box protein At1g61330 [Phoenix dactylifera]XP_026664325.1 putative FBD-associated F-box protein At1g61330 [Phoenix dactylifera]XP_038972374.1 putative FBD-associated F-box protein At1g61330 [Phoenix dactylifera]XP_03